MGYHVVMPGEPGNEGGVPVIVKDGGTGSWRDAKKLFRSWYLYKAKEIRKINEKGYFSA